MLLSEKFQQEELLDRVSMLDQQLYDRSEALGKVIAAKDELHLELEKEVEEKKKLAQQVNHLSLLHALINICYVIHLLFIWAVCSAK